MTLAEPEPTPYDLRFRALGFPVRVHPLFWVVSALMGSNSLQEDNGPVLLALWVFYVFASILVHELGHALAYRAFGADGRVCLYWFGGLAISDHARLTPKQSIAVALAGPGAGFALFAALWASNRASGWAATNEYTEDAYWHLTFINLAWGVVNLLPVLPLDGGRVSREVCGLLRLRHAEQTALKVSVGTGAVMAAYCLANHVGQPAELLSLLPWWARFGSLYSALLFGSMAYSSYEALAQARRRDSYWDYGDDDPWRR